MFKPISLNNSLALVSFITPAPEKLLNQAAQTTQGFPWFPGVSHFPQKTLLNCPSVRFLSFSFSSLSPYPNFLGLILGETIKWGLEVQWILSSASYLKHFPNANALTATWWCVLFLVATLLDLWQFMALQILYDLVVCQPPWKSLSQLSHKPIKLWAAYAFCICQLSGIWQMCSSKQRSS